VWIIPTLIIVVLGILVWQKSHQLDPNKPIKPEIKPVVIQVSSLDWKWLFIYPEEQIATINEITIPVDVPVHFLLTSDTVMNSFFIPNLGSQIMTMPGMRSSLYLISDKEGDYKGISANFSGKGFSGMEFLVRVRDNHGVQAWIKKVKEQGQALDIAKYQSLRQPSSYHPIEYFYPATPSLFEKMISISTEKKG
jgi:cytochrome o ubiquinol oxidase subunit 2